MSIGARRGKPAELIFARCCGAAPVPGPPPSPAHRTVMRGEPMVRVRDDPLSGQLRHRDPGSALRAPPGRSADSNPNPRLCGTCHAKFTTTATGPAESHRFVWRERGPEVGFQIGYR
jgi:hypothetical protein